MAASRKFWVILGGFAILIAISVFILDIEEVKQKAWQIIKPDLMAQNSNLRNKNELLKSENESLKSQNLRLKRYLDAYEKNFIELKDAATNCCQDESIFPDDFPEALTEERFEIRQIYRELLAEKNLWDQYQQAQYKNILESTLEPADIEIQKLNLENEENMEYFNELEAALKLHKRLIRDVRMFHDEIQFQKKQLDAQQEYQLYDLKFKLTNPFARESALVDALQQAMSALSAGIYQQEAVEVIDRLGDELTKPIDQYYERLQDATASSSPTNYNYNIFMLSGKKLMDYSNTLSQQSSIYLDPSTLGELDYFNRRLSQSFYDLYQVGLNETISSTHLDLEQLEQDIDSMN
ncbi:MAG: hypothetical protein PVG87_09295 [Desulfobacteraceae bacterium]